MDELVQAGRIREFLKWVSPKSKRTSKRKQRNRTTGVTVERKSRNAPYRELAVTRSKMSRDCPCGGAGV